MCVIHIFTLDPNKLKYDIYSETDTKACKNWAKKACSSKRALTFSNKYLLSMLDRITLIQCFYFILKPISCATFGDFRPLFLQRSKSDHPGEVLSFLAFHK